LAEFAGDPRDEIEVLEQQLEQLQNQATSAAAQLNLEQGRLQRLVSDSSYSALAEVEEAIDRLQSSISAECVQNFDVPRGKRGNPPELTSVQAPHPFMHNRKYYLFYNSGTARWHNGKWAPEVIEHEGQFYIAA
jgi:hypothetical protein